MRVSCRLEVAWAIVPVAPVGKAPHSPQRSLRRIGSETKPPYPAVEKTSGRSFGSARNSRSLVSIRRGELAKTPRNRGNFSRCLWIRARSLCNSRLGGGEGGIRTHGSFHYTRFPSVRLKPLGHLSQNPTARLRLPPSGPQGAPKRDAQRAKGSRSGVVAASARPGPQSWRRGWDSNPRWALTHTPLAGERLQPLGHLSAASEHSDPPRKIRLPELHRLILQPASRIS
jgi:hypothetical protein